MCAFGFMSPTINHAAHKIDSITFSTAPSLVHFAALKLVLHLPGLDNTIHLILKSYLNGTLSSDIQAISNALTGIGVVPDVDIPSHPAPLKRCSSPSPHSIVLWTKLLGNLVPAPPVLTPPTSPTESIITTELESGSEILLFDDGGALVYHVPEPSSTSSPEPAPYLVRSMAMIPMDSLFESSSSLNHTDVTRPARQMSFIPMTPIMESFEPSDPQDGPSFTSEGDLPDPEGSQPAILLQEADDGDSAELVVPLAVDTNYSVLSNVDSEDSHLSRIDLETACGTVDLGLPIPSRDHIDSLHLRRISSYTRNDYVEVQPRTMLGKRRIFSFRPTRARSIFSR
ncbi:hypothetical protein PILCRDRAFT_541204 [Piloderma croceum F 1598]|uniref:Uncharacterized protein n=1 Tax=Piloderma croceum (strain F 1598) TaxID=765440 RepID=A0A0C3FK95_PILCF|nr:hypothetical protein PILCRDRAFT_541204 [Piloderma croceum F 1598]